MLHSIKVIPNSSQNRIIYKDGKIEKVKIQASPDKGKANRALIRLLSKELSIPKSSIKIIQGVKSRNKVIEINI